MKPSLHACQQKNGNDLRQKKIQGYQNNPTLKHREAQNATCSICAHAQNEVLKNICEICIYTPYVLTADKAWVEYSN
jgi:hypothetical protein